MEPFKHDAGIFGRVYQSDHFTTVSTFSGKHLLEEIDCSRDSFVCVFAEGTLLQVVDWRLRIATRYFGGLYHIQVWKDKVMNMFLQSKWVLDPLDVALNVFSKGTRNFQKIFSEKLWMYGVLVASAGFDPLKEAAGCLVKKDGKISKNLQTLDLDVWKPSKNALKHKNMTWQNPKFAWFYCNKSEQLLLFPLNFLGVWWHPWTKWRRPKVSPVPFVPGVKDRWKPSSTPPKTNERMNVHQEFQVPKMKVLNLIRLFLGWVFPYISLTYSLYRWVPQF